MNAKGIIMSVGMLVFVGAVVVGGTGAFFTDTESSTGNVFTAGSVSLTLGEATYIWLGQPNTTLPTNYFNWNNTTQSIQMPDLKPGDFGRITKPLTNGANDAFLCARIVATSTNPATGANISDYLKFRIGSTGSGATAGNLFAAVPTGQWFSPTTTAALAVPLMAGQTSNLSLEYCFGDFDGPSCDVIGAGAYNHVMNSSVSIDVQYYVIQQRNNANFTCASLNPAPPTPSA